MKQFPRRAAASFRGCSKKVTPLLSRRRNRLLGGVSDRRLRAMFIVGALPALLVVYIRRSVAESPVWQNYSHSTAGMWRSLWRWLAVPFCDRDDGLLQRFQPWHARSLPHLLARAARFLAGLGQHLDHHCHVGQSLAASSSAPGRNVLGAARDHVSPAIGALR